MNANRRCRKVDPDADQGGEHEYASIDAVKDPHLLACTLRRYRQAIRSLVGRLLVNRSLWIAEFRSRGGVGTLTGRPLRMPTR